MTIHIKSPVLPFLITFLIFIYSMLSTVSSNWSDINCDFEQSFCGWTNSHSAVKWKRQNGSLEQLVEGPGYDHTFGNETGHYIYVHAPLNVVEDENLDVTLQSPVLAPTTGSCFSFAYHIFGVRVKSLTVYLLMQNNNKVEAWTRQGSQSNLWHEANITVRSSQNFSIVIEVVVVNPNYQWTIAVDDTKFANGHCHSSPRECDFETGFCDWKFATPLEWYLSNDYELDKEDRPPTDHTMGTFNGQFAFARPVWPGLKDDIAILKSDELPPTNDSCLQLWYLVSDGSNSLKITLRLLGEVETDNELVILNDITKHRWTSVEVPIISAVKYEILLEAKIRNPLVAIDDVILHPRTCESLDICSFQYGFCNWQKNMSSGNFEWLRSTGGIPNEFPSPYYDSTGTDSSYFIFMPVIEGIPEKSVASLRSLSIVISPKMCFSLQYSMNGSLQSVGEIHVVIYDSSGGEIFLRVKRSTEDSQWKFLAIPLTCRSVPDSKIIITVEGITGTGVGYIALDDLQISHQECEKNEHMFDEIRGTGRPICNIQIVPIETTTTEASTTVMTESTTALISTSSMISSSYVTTVNGTDKTTATDSITVTTVTQQDHNETEISTVVTENSTLTSAIPVIITAAHLVCPDSYCFDHGQCSIANGSMNCRCVGPFTGSRCEEMVDEEVPTEKSFFDDKHVFIWITVPLTSILLTVISIMSVSIYRYRKRSWHKEVGLTRVRRSRRTLLYQRNSMSEGDITQTTNSCEEASQYQSVFLPGGSCDLTKGNNTVSAVSDGVYDTANEASQYHSVFLPGGSYEVTKGKCTVLEGAFNTANDITFMSSSDA